MTSQLIPVTVIGGYLGAGKTTLLNRLLAADHGRRLAVLVNDFGSVNIDADLIASHDGDTINLQNGCICCSIADALGDALDQVLELDPPPDQIVIEASGVADPAKIAHYGRGWPGCRLDAVLVLAGAETIRTQSHDQFVGELVTRQLRAGDLVVLTKTDLVDPATAADVEQWVDEVTGGRSTVLRASYGNLDPTLILDPQVDPAAIDEQPIADEPVEPGFEALTLEVRPYRRRDAMEAVLEAWPDEIVRVKGVVELDQPGSYWVIQRVGRRWSIESWDRPDPPRSAGRLLLIARVGSIDLDACLLPLG